MRFVVRDAVQSDGPVVAGLLGELGYPTTQDRVDAQLRRGSAHGSQVIVAVQGDAVVGFAALQHNYAFAEDQAMCRLSAIAVARAARGRGVGRLVVESVEQQAVAAGASTVAINCGLRPERASAHRLYQRLGYDGSPTDDHVDYVKQLR